MIDATCLKIMFILSQTTIIFFDFPVNIWIASFVVYAFQGSTILQLGVYFSPSVPLLSSSVNLCAYEFSFLSTLSMF